MTWCNKFGIHYLFNDVLVHFYLSLFYVLYFMSILVCIFCTVHDLSVYVLHRRSKSWVPYK